MIYLHPDWYAALERELQRPLPKPLNEAELAGYEKWRAARANWDHDTCQHNFYKMRWAKHRYRHRDRP